MTRRSALWAIITLRRYRDRRQAATVAQAYAYRHMRSLRTDDAIQRRRFRDDRGEASFAGIMTVVGLLFAIVVTYGLVVTFSEVHAGQHCTPATCSRPAR